MKKVKSPYVYVSRYINGSECRKCSEMLLNLEKISDRGIILRLNAKGSTNVNKSRKVQTDTAGILTEGYCETVNSGPLIILCSYTYSTSTMFFSLLFFYFCSSLMFQVNLEYLESKLESVDGEEVQRIQDNINSLFHHCVQALGEEHQIKVVNALQVNTAQEGVTYFFNCVTIISDVS